MSQREGHKAEEGVIFPQPSTDPSQARPHRHSPDPSNSVQVSDAPPIPLPSALDSAQRTSDRGDAPIVDSNSHVILELARSDRLPPTPLCVPITIHDAALDEFQRDAVCRALACTDVFVIQGPSGTGKTRTAVEIVRQSVASGGRVLFLSPDPSRLDSQLLAIASQLPLVRLLDLAEAIDALPRELVNLTFANRQVAIRTQLQVESSSALAIARERAERAESLVRTWEELASVRRAIDGRTAERDSLQARRHSLAEEVQRDAESTSEPVPYYVQRLRGSIASHHRRVSVVDTAYADLNSAKSEAINQLKSAESDCHNLRPRLQAREQGRWYTLTYWKARSDATLSSRLSEAQERLTSAKRQLDELAVREQKLAADRRQADDEFTAERTRMLDSEVARRAAELEERLAAIEEELANDTKREQSLCLDAGRELAEDPTTLSAEREAARLALEEALARADDVANRLEELVQAQTDRVAVVAGPISAIADNVEVARFAPYALVVIDDAHLLVEAEFHACANFGNKWVLLGQSCELPQGKRRQTQFEFFAKLAYALRHDVWIRDGDRLLCRLYPVRGADRRRLECEPVADAPDIELRLFSPPEGNPTLAEVVFPDRFDPSAAREYLFRELGEVTCQPQTRTTNWETRPDSIVVRFGPTDPQSRLAEVGDGVREEVVGTETRAIHFSPGWSLDQAREWTAENVARRDPGRFVNLANPFRNCPGLARWLNRAFSAGFAVPSGTDDTPHVEFLAVPDTDPRRRREPQGRPTRLGGAGYEIDLSDPRQRAAVPADFQDLPSTGFVNVPEAQALVRYLEAHPSSGLAITSPFPTQVAVLRRLVGKSARLAKAVVLDAAEAARHECDLLAVSLTRSHVARAVTFGETPAILAALLVRARKKLLLAGDPGTLARRLQWEGPVDHLDAAEAARERDWVAALADCPRVTQPRPRPYAEHVRS